MEPPRASVLVEPVAATAGRVRVQWNGIHIRDLTIDQRSTLEYLQLIAPEKLEIALLHALDVGVLEIQARRQRRQ